MQKLINVQAKLKAPKNQYNSFGKFSYRSAEDILEALKPLLAEEGLQLTLKTKPVLVGDWHYMECTATITDGKEVVTVEASAREAEQKKGMDDSQISGTATSYAKKYALDNLFLIDDAKDADTESYSKPSQSAGGTKGAQKKQTAPQTSSQPVTDMSPCTQDQTNKLMVLVNEFAALKGKTNEEVLNALNETKVVKASGYAGGNYTSAQIELAIGQLQSWITVTKG